MVFIDTRLISFQFILDSPFRGILPEGREVEGESGVGERGATKEGKTQSLEAKEGY